MVLAWNANQLEEFSFFFFNCLFSAGVIANITSEMSVQSHMWLCITRALKGGHFESWSEQMQQQHGGGLIIESKFLGTSPPA